MKVLNRASESSRLAVCLELATAIGRSTTLDEVYEAALDALAEGLGLRRAAVLLFDTDNVMRFKAWRGISEVYRTAVEGHSPWQRGELDAVPVVVSDVTRDLSLSKLLPAIRAERIGAMAFIPLIREGGVIGKFMLYFDFPRSLDAEELQLAGVVAAQVSFAAAGFRAQLEAADNHARLEFALDAANMGTWDWDLHTNTIRWSENLERLHGLAPGTFDGTFEAYKREICPEDRERVLASIEHAVTEGALHQVEYRVVRPDGTTRWVEGKGRVEYEGSVPIRMSGVCMDVTERKAAYSARVEALEDSNQWSLRLAAIVESTDDAIIAKDLNGIITAWNLAAERTFGYTPDEAIGKSILMIIPDDRRAEEDLIISRVHAGHALELETVRLHKDGSLVDIALTVSPLRNQEGTIIGASKIARDISARKRAERELADLHRGLTTLVGASASLLQTPDADSVRNATLNIAKQLLEADGYALWLLDGDPRVWRVIKSEGISTDFSGRSLVEEDETTSSASVLLTEALAVEDVGALSLLEAQRHFYEREGVRSMLVCPMRIGPSGAGTLVYYYRERHAFNRVEIQTAQALANLSAAALNTADLYEAQRRGRETAESAGRHAAFLANAAAVLSESLDYQQTLGAVARLAVPDIADWCAVDIVTDDGARERLAIAHVDPAKLEDVRALERRYPSDPNARGGVPFVIRTGQPAVLENISPEQLEAAARNDDHRRLLNSLAVCSYMCVPLASPSGTFGAITFAFAESGRHYVREDLNFAQEVAARASLAIENARAYRRTQEANRLKDEFLATLSHELRTPLNAILGYAQMLKVQMLKGQQASQAIEIVTRNAEGLRQIIDDVLDVSRIVAGKIRLNVKATDLPAILRTALATIRPAADAKGVALEFEAERTRLVVSGDPDRLQQIAWNLLSNAVKFTPRGGRVQARIALVDSNVELQVVDTGQGIDSEFLPHVFERFRQADSRFSRDHGGLGIGLSIVRELVQLHGGVATASSDGLGRGSTFVVRLPAMVDRASAGRKRSSGRLRRRQDQTEIAQKKKLDGIRILAVDDEADALELLRLVLESAGAVVKTAASGAQALDTLRSHQQDLLIADVGMPRMDGLTLVKTIRNTLPSPANAIPAVALSAYARSEDRKTALASGFQKHVAKPFNPAELVTALSSLVPRQLRSRASRQAT
jgi:PAS domain S-box-containing protein